MLALMKQYITSSNNNTTTPAFHVHLAYRTNKDTTTEMKFLFRSWTTAFALPQSNRFTHKFIPYFLSHFSPRHDVSQPRKKEWKRREARNIVPASHQPLIVLQSTKQPYTVTNKQTWRTARKPPDAKPVFGIDPCFWVTVRSGWCRSWTRGCRVQHGHVILVFGFGSGGGHVEVRCVYIGQVVKSALL